MCPTDAIEMSARIRAGEYECKLPWGSGREAREAYRTEAYRLRTKFKHDIEIEFNTVGHPKAEKLFDIAWAEGHSEGYESVFHWYAQLVELVD